MRVLCVKAKYYNRHPVTKAFMGKLFRRDVIYEIEDLPFRPHNAFLNECFMSEDGRKPLELPEDDVPAQVRRKRLECPRCRGKGYIHEESESEDQTEPMTLSGKRRKGGGL